MVKRTEAEKILAKQNQAMLKNIKRRVKRIEAKFGSSYATDMYYKRLVKTNLTSTRGLSLKQLKQQAKELQYIQSLKSSTVKGAKTAEVYNEIKDSLTLSNDDQALDRFYSLYDKLVEENLLLMHYKYDVMETINTMILQNASDEAIHDYIMELFDELQAAEAEIELKNTIRF